MNLNYEITSKEIKSSYPNELALVKYNISYPNFSCRKNTAYLKETEKRFNGFYGALALGFENFAKTKLYKEAKRFKSIEGKESTPPFGAVMKHICSYSDENIVSIVTDAFVYYGESREMKRTSQNWDVTKGRILVYEDFFEDDDRERILLGIKSESAIKREVEKTVYKEGFEKKIKRGFSKNNFYLTPKGYGFFYPPEYLSEDKNPEVFFLLGFKGNGKFNPF